MTIKTRDDRGHGKNASHDSASSANWDGAEQATIASKDLSGSAFRKPAGIVFDDLPKLRQFAIVTAKFVISLFAVWFVVVFALGGLPRVRQAYFNWAEMITGRAFKVTSPSTEQITAAGSLPVGAASGPESDWLYGDWILVSSGGEDGRTACSEFSSPKLYRLNGKTGSIQTFRRNGEFRSIFIYTTPSAEEHYTVTKARWSLDRNFIKRTEITKQDAFKTLGGTDAARVRRDGANVLTLGDEDTGRFVRCSGGTGGSYGD